MSAANELMKLMAKITNEIDNGILDPEFAFFDHEDDEEIDDLRGKLGYALHMIETLYPLVQITEDILDGNIGPAVYVKRWNIVQDTLNEIQEDEGARDVDISPLLKPFTAGDAT